MNHADRYEVPSPIRAEVLAAKMVAIERFEYPTLLSQVTENPRLNELLWHIEWQFRQPGGILAFTDEFLQVFSDQIQTETMSKLGGDARARYTVPEVEEIWHDFPSGERLGCPEHSDYFLVDLFLDDNETAFASERREATQRMARDVQKLNFQYFKELCENAARRRLPFDLAALCNEISKPFGDVWYFQDLIPTLLKFIDLRAKRILGRLAPTAITAAVWDGLEFVEGKCYVRIEGDSRFGKTEAVQAFAEAWPGRARLITTPCRNRDVDLYKAIALAFGIPSEGVSANDLADKVEFVIGAAKLLLIYDEAAYLIPQKFTADTQPSRLNWVRAQIDRGCPAAFVVTQQSYQGSVNRFIKKTRFAFEQVVGRAAMVVELPKELSREEMLAVVRIHLPDLDEDCQLLVAGEAKQSESYLKAVEFIAKRARYLAKKRCTPVGLEEIEAAIWDVLPQTRKRKTSLKAIPASEAAGGMNLPPSPNRRCASHAIVLQSTPVSADKAAKSDFGDEEADLDLNRVGEHLTQK